VADQKQISKLLEKLMVVSSFCSIEIVTGDLGETTEPSTLRAPFRVEATNGDFEMGLG